MPTRYSILLLCCAAVGCRGGSKFFVTAPPASVARPVASTQPAESPKARLASFQAEQAPSEPRTPAPPRRLPPPSAESPPELSPADGAGAGEVLTQPELIDSPPAEPSYATDGLPTAGPTLLDVVESTRLHFPLIRQAAAGRIVASGEALSAYGAFDRKLDGFGNVQPLDFFENHWYKFGLKRDTMWGGQVGAGYKLGRGSFEPWFLERETNDLGEFSLTVSAPIGRDFRIDANRAELWRAQLERGRVEPVIRAQVIQAVREGVRAYWEWVAARANLAIAEDVLRLGLDRVEFLTKEVELGEKAEIDLVDNRRIIVDRRAKLIDSQRKFEQASVKLSLYLRSPDGRPVVPLAESAPTAFPEPIAPDEATLATDVEFAVATRPELAELSVVQRQLNIAYRQAINETRPDVDTGLFFGQDVGNPTSSNNKSEFEIEATLTVSVPLERRKALGKVRQLRGKLTQLRAKQQFAAEKVSAEVQIARAALTAAAQRAEQTAQGVELAQRMQAAERRLYELGQSTLFNLNLREKQAADAAADNVLAQRDFFLALAEYVAALGLDGASLDAIYASPDDTDVRPADPGP